MRINILKEFLAGFITTFVLVSVILFVISSGNFKCTFKCYPFDLVYASSKFILQAVILSATDTAMYLIWRQFDPEVIAFPLLTFSRLFNKELDKINALKILVAQFLGGFLAIALVINVSALMFAESVADKELLNKIGAGGNSAMDYVLLSILNILKEVTIADAVETLQSHSIMYFAAVGIFYVLFDNKEKNLMYNGLVLFCFTLLVYAFSGDIFLNALSFQVSTFSKPGVPSHDLGSLEYLFTYLGDVLAYIIVDGGMFFLVAVCAMFAANYVKREIFELGKTFEEDLGSPKKAAPKKSRK